MRLSASRLKTWGRCSLQAKFQYVDRLPQRQNAKASFGTIIHKCLESYHNGNDIEKCVEMFREYWEHPEILGVEPDYWPKFTSYGSLREKGVEILREYHEKNKWEHRTTLASEHPFLVPFGDHELTGFVDFLELKKAGNGKRTLRIIDFKTASRVPTKLQLRMDIQFTVYQYASEQPEFFMGNGPDFPGMPNGEQLFEDMQRVPRKVIWYDAMNNKEISAGDRDETDYMILYRTAKEIERAEKAQVYVPKIGEECIFCPYTKECGITIPTYEEVEADIL